MTRIVLVRHGQTEWNRLERFRGRAGVPLNERGREQAEAVGRRLAAEEALTAVYSIPLSCAMDTAKAVAQPPHPDVTTEPRFIDIDYGRWQGLTVDGTTSTWPREVDARFAVPHAATVPAGETPAQVRVRAMGALEEIGGMHATRSVALVSHALVNLLTLLAILGLGRDRFWHLCQGTAAVDVIEAGQGDYTLVTMNGTGHLPLGQ